MNKKEYNHFYKKDGFTYVELLIVVGIMIIFGVFFVMAVDPVGKIKAQRDSQRESDINSVLLSVEQKIRNDRGWDCLFGPLPQDKFTAIGTGPGEYDLYGCLMPNYLSKYLVDPKEGSITGRNITDGLVGHWKFDEGSGTIAYDASGNNNHGTLVDGPNWVDGKIGGALDFDGAGDYVDAGNDASLNITDAITISAWAKPINPGANQKVVSSYLGNKRFVLGIASSHIYIDLWTTGGDTNYSSQVYGNITPAWNYLILTYLPSDGYYKMYVNGNDVGHRDTDGNPLKPLTNNVLIGALVSGDYSFNGLIDDVRIYNRALSPEEIQDLYNYEYSSKYAIWQNPVTKNISLKSLEDETKEVSTGAPD